MYLAVVIVHIVCAIALILIVLLQAGKGTGIANVFGGAGQTVFGARTGDVLAKGTEVCAALFMATSLTLAVLSSDRSSSVMRKNYSDTSGQAVPMTAGASSAASQATMEKIKQAMAGFTQSVKQAATNAQSAAQPGSAQAPVAQAPAAGSIAQPLAQPAAPSSTPSTEQSTTPSQNK